MFYRRILRTQKCPLLLLFITVVDVLLLLIVAVVGGYLVSPGVTLASPGHSLAFPASLASLASLNLFPTSASALTSVSASVAFLILNSWKQKEGNQSQLNRDRNWNLIGNFYLPVIYYSIWIIEFFSPGTFILFFVVDLEHRLGLMSWNGGKQTEECREYHDEHDTVCT